MQVSQETALDGSHYQATFKLAGTGIARVSLDGAFIDVNEQFCELLGYSKEYFLNSRFQDITFPDDLDKNANLLAQLASGEVDHYRLQKRYIRSNGEILWTDLTVVADKDVSGEVVSLVSIISDIRDFKNTEERMGFLLGELAHRSKNLFTVVQSVINQTNADNVEEFRTLINQRIWSLAASQDLLLNEAAKFASLGELVATQLGAFVAVNDTRVTCAITPVDLGANATRVLAMAVHELATNSCKYGALSHLSGRLNISCEVDPDDTEFVVISWVERGGPEVVPPKRSGFGRKVIERMVSRSLNADVELSFEPPGVEWRCRTRAENLRT